MFISRRTPPQPRYLAQQVLAGLLLLGLGTGCQPGADSGKAVPAAAGRVEQAPTRLATHRQLFGLITAYHQLPVATTREQHRNILEQNLELGFMRVARPAALGWADILVLHAEEEDAPPVICYAEVACAGTCRQALHLYQVQDGAVKEVTQAVLPSLNHQELLDPYVSYRTQAMDVWVDVQAETGTLAALVYDPQAVHKPEDSPPAGDLLYTLQWDGERLIATFPKASLAPNS